MLIEKYRSEKELSILIFLGSGQLMRGTFQIQISEASCCLMAWKKKKIPHNASTFTLTFTWIQRINMLIPYVEKCHLFPSILNPPLYVF